jgi:uncharacterized protein YdeI (YjbR/CyaY-like superfamily)
MSMTITIYSAKEFRGWLQKHHKKESKVAVVVHKRHTGKSAPTHRELLEEALCFGWIDVTIKRLDEDTFVRNFTKRNENSKWSDNTLSYAKQLLKDGRMKAQGIHFYKLGLTKPTHDHGIPKNPEMPLELKSALVKNAKARKGFEKFPPSVRRMYYRWILSGKQEATREKRVEKVVAAALGKGSPFGANTAAQG